MEDDDSCRICRSGPEPGAPLYYPCKCTGSIRYCHQDCLVEWLQHSRKKYCELCNHPFIFHKKYRRDMPADGKLPRYLYARRLAVRAVQLTQLAARALLVGFTWLALLPYININTWRFMFWSIDVAAWMGLPGSLPPFSMETPPANISASQFSARPDSVTNSSAGLPVITLVRNRNVSIFQAGSLSYTPISMANAKSVLRFFIQKLAHDVFEGQLLSCAIVVFFVGVFLLREWILQNMPQNFDNHPNNDGAPQPQPLPDGPPQLRAELQARRREDLVEQERLDRLIGQLQEFEADHPLQEEVADQSLPQAHELDLDAETQRVQAREARIRHLEQLGNGRPHGDPPATALHDHEAVHDASAHDHADQVLDTIPDDHVRKPPRTVGDFTAVMKPSHTQDLQQALGWSENSFVSQEQQAALDDGTLDVHHAEAQAGPSEPRLSRASYEQTRTIEIGSESDDESERADKSELGGVPVDGEQNHVASTLRTAVEPTAVEATDSDHADNEVGSAQDAAAETRPGEPWPSTNEADARGLAEAFEGQEEEDAWEDESDGEGIGAHHLLDPHDEAALRAAAAAAFPPPIVHPAAAEDEIEILAGQAEDPEADIGLAEEMDGILEAVGMRGPLFGIVQNLFLMIFLCGFVMLAFVMLPYIVGRLLGSGPGLVKLLALPVKMLRYVTDPVFDALIALGANSVWPKLAALVGLHPPSTQAAGKLVAQTASTSAPIHAWVQKYLPSFLSQTAADNTKLLTQQVIQAPVAGRTSATAAMLLRLLPTTLTASSQWKAVSDAFDVALATGVHGTVQRIADYVAALFVRLDAHRIGTSSTDRIFCVAFGHCYWLLILFVHQHFSKPDLQRALAEQSAFKMFMDQHVLIIKAISFIFIELIVFPLGCGLLFDICTMPFFAEASVMLWPGRVRAAPLSFAFTRWMCGTIYMFVFAQYVSATRKVLRPGVLCWIRDPNDPSFHPIREILDKKTLTQLRKIGASAIMYAAILVASVGVNTYFMRYALGATGILPLRWKPFEPLTDVPVDLVMVHFALPWATQRFDPDAVSERWLKAWWKGTSHALRLSSYMIGGEFQDERRRARVSPFVAAWNALLHRKVDVDGQDEYVQDGGLCRVPDDDKAITSGPLIIPLNPDGTPPTERLAEAIAKQETEAEKHTPKPTYTHIYLPSNYRARIISILTLLWLSHSLLFILGLSVPLVIGRTLIAVLSRSAVHDFYSFSLGLILLLVSNQTVKGIHKMWTRRIRRAKAYKTSPTNYMTIHMLVKLKRLVKALVLLLGVAGLVPLTIGLLVDQYVLVPLRDSSTQVPVLHLGQVWACGVIEARLVLFSARFIGVPSTGVVARFMSNVDHVVRGGLYPRPKVRVAWKRIVVPVVVGGALMLCIPVGVAYALARTEWVRVESREDEQVLMRKVFGAVQSVLLIAVVREAMRKRMESWTEILKDEVFLESTELKNFHPDQAKGKARRRGLRAEEEEMVVGENPAEDPNERVTEEEKMDEYVAEGTLPDSLFR